MAEEIILEKLNRKEALRYLGYKNYAPDERIESMMDECEEELLLSAIPRYVYRCFDLVDEENGIRLDNTNLVLTGNSIREHLLGCEKAVVIAATISDRVDKLIRICQIKDMTKALIMDSMASVCVEQLCDKIDLIIKDEFSQYNQTFRFGIGYGDLPLSLQPEILNVLQASKIIGLTVSDSYLMNPVKSVTSIIGLTKGTVAKKSRGCQTCNMRDICRFRAEGGHCNG